MNRIDNLIAPIFDRDAALAERLARFLETEPADSPKRKRVLEILDAARARKEAAERARKP